MKRRYIISVLVSTVIWFLFPFMMELTSGTKTEAGWMRFWSDFPAFVVSWLGMLLPVAILMHVFFARITIRLKGWKFWAFPAVSLFVACIVYWTVALAYSIVESRAFNDLSLGDWFYGVLWVLAVVYISMVWISYPLAILNQMTIRWLLAEQVVEANPDCSPRE